MRIPGWQAQFSEYKSAIHYAGFVLPFAASLRKRCRGGGWTGTDDNCSYCGDHCLGYGTCFNGRCTCWDGRPRCGSQCCYQWEKCCGTQCIDKNLDCCDPTKNFHCDDPSEKCCGLNSCFNPEEVDCCGTFPDKFGCTRPELQCCGGICIEGRHL